MSNKQDRLLLRAPAKINLYLEVLGRRENGYHDIRSVVVPVSLYDVVKLEKTDGPIETTVETSTIVTGEATWLTKPEDNLTTRAAVLLKQTTGYPGGARIHLEKNIPVGGGLGGGSSDAATVLTGLNRLWQTGIPKEKLMRIGSQLGSDVPAMVHDGAVCIEGIGERVMPIRSRVQPSSHREGGGSEKAEETTDKTGWWVVILNPGFGVSTRDIYSRYAPSLTSGRIPFSSMVSALREGNTALVGSSLFNDLQKTVFMKYPLVGIIAESLEKAGAIGVSLSGSGASVFGLARDEGHAHSIEQHARKTLGFPVWRRVVRTLPDGVMVAHGPLEA